MDGRIGAVRARARRRGLRRHADRRLQRQVRVRLLRPVSRGGRLDPRLRRPPRLPDGPRQRRRGRARGAARRRRGRRRRHGQAGARLPRRHPPRQGRHAHARRRLQRQRRVCDGEGGRGRRRARRARRGAGDADLHPPRRCRHHHQLPREGRSPVASRRDRHDTTEDPLAQGRRRGRDGRPRPPPAEPHAGQLPARAAAVRRRRQARRDRRGRGPAPRPAPARRAHHPPGHADLRHPRARLRLDARRREGRSRAPVAGREDHQLAPRRQPQLPAQPRLQHVVHARRRGRLQARAAGHARPHAGADRRDVDPPAADAQAVQDPHGARDGRRHEVAVDRGRRAGARRARGRALRRARPRRHPRHAGRPAGRLASPTTPPPRSSA